MGTLASALLPVATALSTAPRVYVDANLPARLVSLMRRDLGWDVLFVLEHDDLRRAPDRDHFHHALDFGRTLITHDHDFFDDRRFPPALCPGVIVCTAPDEPALVRMLRYADRALLRASGCIDLPLRGKKIELTADIV